MDVQELSSGRWSVVYGEPKAYQSSLRVSEQYPSAVSYVDAKSGEEVGMVYRDYYHGGRWYLTSLYLGWNPVVVFSKYEGFLLLLNLRKQN